MTRRSYAGAFFVKEAKIMDIGTAGWLSFVGALIGGILLVLFQVKKLKTRDWVEIGVMLALAFALKFISKQLIPSFRVWAQGGSITIASMVPIFYLSLKRGWAVGAFAGVIFGLYDFLLSPYFYHPAQFFLDYPIAFGLLGISGLFQKNFALGITFGGLARLFSHFLSGVIFFASYAPAGWNAYLYSLAYNSSFMLPEILISVYVMTLLWPRLKWVQAGSGS